MRENIVFWLVLSLLISSQAFPAYAQGKISGLAYIDYYSIPDHHNEDIKGMNGFWLRRAYFTYDHKLSSAFKFRFRLEGNSTGDFKSKSKIEPYIKDLYLEYKWKETSFFLGLSTTPSWGQVEKYWGYRSVEKTALDLQKLGSSRDFGVAVKGSAVDKKIYYHFMLANGEGTKGEVNQQKKAYAAVGFSPVKKIYFEFYGDYSPEAKGNSEVFTLQAFFGHRGEKIRTGLQYFYHSRSGEEEDLDLSTVSGFVVLYLKERINLLIRVDRMFQPNPYGKKIDYMPFDAASANTVFLLGLDHKAADHVNIIPNIAYVNYTDIAAGDLYFKLTTALTW